MQIHVDQTHVAAILLVSIRFGTVFFMTPVFGTAQLPVRNRIFLVLALSATTVLALGLRLSDMPAQAGELLIAALGEVVLGMLFAFGLFAGFGAFMFGGRVLDMQIGFGIASLMDPATRHQSPLLGTVLNLLAVVLFFAVDGHNIVIRALAYSLEKFPPGLFAGRIDFPAIVAMFGSLFTLGLALVAPVVFCIFLIDIGLAIISRTMPQMNILSLAFSVKIIAGMALLAVSVQTMAPLMQRIFTTIFGYWERILA